jgi:23S rRNA (guanosine2251-2'-O)-methyltransferase
LKVPPEKLNRLTTKKHQGVIGFMAAIQYASLDHIISTAYSQGKDPFVLILDRVTDVRNFGAIARTAECFGVHALVVSARGGARIGGDAMKTSAGALSHIPVCREMSLTGAVHFLKSNGLSIVACTEKAEVSLIKTDMSGPLAIVLGSEEDGISEEVLQLCDQQAQIPMQGRIASLNVSVAAGIILYQATSQR